MSPTRYLSFGLNLFAAVAMTAPAYPAAPASGVVESPVTSRPTPAHTEGTFRLALPVEEDGTYCSYVIETLHEGSSEDCGFDASQLPG
jgi:hypothetical protein